MVIRSTATWRKLCPTGSSHSGPGRTPGDIGGRTRSRSSLLKGLPVQVQGTVSENAVAE